MAVLQNDWFVVDNIDQIDSPALLVYTERVKKNIHILKSIVKDVTMLRPHVKTNKIAEVCRMMLDEGIHKFKCATIAEADMLGSIQAPDVLMSYQPVGPKVERFLELIKMYPATRFSCLIDNIDNARVINQACQANDIVLDVFIDLNVGMNRTGILPEETLTLFKQMLPLKNIHIVGLHAYDGHIRDTDLAQRQLKSDVGFQRVVVLSEQIQNITNQPLTIVVGGTPTFPTHARRENVECSPGTFIFWDWGYDQILPDEDFIYAALVLTRVISIVDNQTICLDLGHKSVAAENPLPRVHFLNAPNATPVSQSEEHLVVKVKNALNYNIGDVFYGVPVHICPTVALYDKAQVVIEKSAQTTWDVVARNRFIRV
jgi:D-threonine aldolase